jgi:superfamily I DNA and RNA helicase
VLVLCFNHHLGNWLAAAVRGFGPSQVVAGNVHAILRQRIMKSSLASDLAQAEAAGMEGGELFGRLYYELGALAIEESGEQFDHIVFDEVQDLPARAVGDLVAAWTHSRRDRRVLLLGDFTRQALYTGSAASSTPLLEAVFGSLPVFNLRVNCRNTRRTALQTRILSGFGEQRVSERQPDTLSIGGWSIRELGQANSGELAYCTIHGFKGLERPVVIIIDAEAASIDESDALLYVAMSRARLRLFMLAPQTAHGAIEQRLALAAFTAAGARQP